MFVPITNTPRGYAWGSTTAIAELLGRRPSGQPEAELWLGAHAGSPAVVVLHRDEALWGSESGGHRTKADRLHFRPWEADGLLKLDAHCRCRYWLARIGSPNLIRCPSGVRTLNSRMPHGWSSGSEATGAPRAESSW